MIIPSAVPSSHSSMTSYNMNVHPNMQMNLSSCSNYLQSKLESTTILEFPLQPKVKSETPGQTCTKICTHCKEEKKLEEFNKHPHGPMGRDHRCKVCQNNHAKCLREAKKNAPPRPDACDCCGITGKKLVVDHIRDTSTARGWLCNNCNKSIGALGDTLEGVMQAVKYLSRETTNRC